MSPCEVITLKQILLLSPVLKQRGDPFSWLPGSDEPYQATKIEILLFWEGKIRKALVPSLLIDLCPSEACLFGYVTHDSH